MSKIHLYCYQGGFFSPFSVLMVTSDSIICFYPSFFLAVSNFIQFQFDVQSDVLKSHGCGDGSEQADKGYYSFSLLSSKPLYSPIATAACAWETPRAVQGFGGFLWADRNGGGELVVEKKQLWKSVLSASKLTSGFRQFQLHLLKHRVLYM